MTPAAISAGICTGVIGHVSCAEPPPSTPSPPVGGSVGQINTVPPLLPPPAVIVTSPDVGAPGGGGFMHDPGWPVDPGPGLEPGVSFGIIVAVVVHDNVGLRVRESLAHDRGFFDFGQILHSGSSFLGGNNLVFPGLITQMQVESGTPNNPYGSGGFHFGPEPYIGIIKPPPIGGIATVIHDSGADVP